MKLLVPLAAALVMAGSALAFSTPAAAQPRQQCLQQNMVNGWNVIDDNTLIVTDRVGRQYRVSLAAGCRDLDWPMRLGWSSGTGFGIGCIGRNDFLYVPATGARFSQRCLIRNVEPLGRLQRTDSYDGYRRRY